MFERFTKDARRIVDDAVDLARESGATTIEAEHLLLAVTRGNDPVARALASHGLDEDELTNALVMETERSLAAVGVTAETPAFSPFPGSPRLATSAKAALEGALRVAVERRDRHIGTKHLVLALLRPERGTLPRALAIAGLDRSALRDAVG